MSNHLLMMVRNVLFAKAALLLGRKDRPTLGQAPTQPYDSACTVRFFWKEEHLPVWWLLLKGAQMFKLDFKKAEEPEIKLPASPGSWKKKDNSRKTSTSALLTIPKPLTMWIPTNCGKFFKRCENQTTLPVSWEVCMQVKKQQLEPDMEKWNGSPLGKEYFEAV